MLPADPFGRRVRPARKFDRAGRVGMLAEVAAALVAGELADREAAAFVGGALQRWLTDGGDLLGGGHLGVKGPRCSRRTPQWVFEQLQAESHRDDGTE